MLITWSEPYLELGGQMLAAIAHRWQLPLREAAQRLQPAGAVYHCMTEADVERILSHDSTLIGSDGLPRDPRPHPRLWGTFPRVLGRLVRDRGLFSLSQAVSKMTARTAQRFGLADRGVIQSGAHADLVLFDAETVGDLATYAEPTRRARGIVGVWVNGLLSFWEQAAGAARAGRLLRRSRS